MEAQYDKCGIHVSDQWNCKYSKMKLTLSLYVNLTFGYKIHLAHIVIISM